MRDRVNKAKRELLERAGETVASAVQRSMSSGKAHDAVASVRQRYRGVPDDRLADLLIRSATRRTQWEGAANGLGVTGCGMVLAAPVPDPIHKTAAGLGAVGLLLTDLAFVTRIQMQLILSLADLYRCPLDPDDEEDVWIVFKAALGLKGTERIGTFSRYVFTETARKQFRKLLRTGIRRAIQELVIKIAGKQVGRYLGEKYVMRLIPVANAGIGYAFNREVTKAVGRWGKVKAKVRCSAFECVEGLRDCDSSILVWVLPVIFYVGTADDRLTDNVLTLYSQTAKRLDLDEDQLHFVEQVIDNDDLLEMLKDGLSQGQPPAARELLYELALTTAAVDLTSIPELEACLTEVAHALSVTKMESDLSQRIKQFQA